MAADWVIIHCPWCGGEMPEFVENSPGYQYQYRQYTCHKCKVTWDVRRHKVTGSMTLESCSLYPIEEYRDSFSLRIGRALAWSALFSRP